MNVATVPWVVKFGGRELSPGPELSRLAAVLASAVAAGVPTVVVHGGGDEISARAEALGLPVERIGGQRVTDPPMLEVVIEVLAGRVNTRLVAALATAGVPALGLTGMSGHLLRVRPLPGLGFVGEPTKVRAALLRRLLSEGHTPVLAPIGAGPSGSPYNVNADLAAGAIAGAIRAHLSLVTDVPAVLDREGRPIAELASSRIPALLRDGTARDGMIPKLTAVAAALAAGAPTAWIGDLDGLRAPGGPRSPGTIVVGPEAEPRVVRRAIGRPEGVR